jgi:alpha-1,2-rhamnosyltransferase
MYDLIPLRHPEFCFALVPHIFQLWLGQMLRLADAVVCISGATEQDLRDYARDTHTSLPPTGHFHLGSDLVRTHSKGEVRQSLGQFFVGPSPCFVGIGSFEPKKNYDFLLDVFERMWAQGFNIRLLVIGRESAESYALIKRVRQHAEQGRKLLTLFDASDAEIAFSYAKCRALVFPSLAEGFGLPLVEARMHGAIVIASSLPAFIELADDGVYIYPEESHEALEALILKHSKRDLRLDVAPMHPFLWKDSAAQCLGLMEKLLTQEKI